MILGLVIIMLLIFILPFSIKKIEHNLEVFLLIMGFLAVIISGKFSLELWSHILTNKLLYFITGAVLIAGIIFYFTAKKIKLLVNKILKYIPLHWFVFVLIVLLGLVSSFITAIIASLILVEVIHALPVKHEVKVKISVLACFSIGSGAILTPIGEPLSTIVVSLLKQDFGFLFRELGLRIIINVIIFALIGMIIIIKTKKQDTVFSPANIDELQVIFQEEKNILPEEKLRSVFIKAGKIFLFIIALELLGAGFKPLIEAYVIHLDQRLLYWINTISAVLDNATLAAAEISPSMSISQTNSILMGLILSGGMLIPGNIPNIIAAGKLNIKSKEWAKYGIPVGFGIMTFNFIIILLLK